MTNISNYLGDADLSQKTINDDVNYSKIIKIFLEKIDVLNEVYNKEDQFETKVFEGLKNSEIIFPINKHIEIYILKYISDIKKIFKYLVFRYKFFICGQEKLNLGYPPYLLI